MVKTVNPTTGEVLREYEVRGADWLESRVVSSVQTFGSWHRLSLDERLHCVQKFEGSLRSAREELARLMTVEMGKPIKQAYAEIDKCISSCQFLREQFPLWLGEHEYTTERGHSVHLNALGPLLGIMPWNFPLWQVVRFAIPALLNGNTILLKHAPNTWGCAEKIAAIFGSAFPAGVYLHLPIEIDLTEKVIADPRVRGVSLTGSTRAGSSVAALAGRHLKKCVLELGGSDAYVVFEDADLDRAVQTCVDARLQNNGQSCVAAKRFIVHRRVVSAFVEKMVARMSAKKVGDPLNTDVDVGPMARVDLRLGLDEQVRASVAAGAVVALGGAAMDGRGFFYAPSVLTGVTPGMIAFDEELFGPVAAVVEAASDEEAIGLANRSRYGLGGAIFSRDIERARAIAASDFEAGMIAVNDFVKSDASAPFGGIKDSGLGRELGREGCFEFVNVKMVKG